MEMIRNSSYILIICAMVSLFSSCSQGDLRQGTFRENSAVFTPQYCNDDRIKEVVLSKSVFYRAFVGKMLKEGNPGKIKDKNAYEKFCRQYNQEEQIIYSNGKLVVQRVGTIFHLDHIVTLNTSEDNESCECAAEFHLEGTRTAERDAIPIQYTFSISDNGENRDISVTMLSHTF